MNPFVATKKEEPIMTEVVGSPLGKVSFPNSTAEILQAADRYRSLTIAGINDKVGFEAVRSARISVKNARTSVEATRKILKAESLEYGRAVDAEAKRLTALLEPIEADLEAKEKAITDEKARIQKAIEVEAERKAEQAKIDEERRIAAEQLATERAKLASERAEIERQARELQAKKDAEQKAINDAAAEAARVERERAEIQRKLELLPVREKIMAFADGIDAIECQTFMPEINAALTGIVRRASAEVRRLAENL